MDWNYIWTFIAGIIVGEMFAIWVLAMCRMGKGN